MATINPTGMGYKTSRQYRRIMDDIMKYANSVYIYEELNSVGDEWYNSHGTMRSGIVKHTMKIHTTRSPAFYPTHVSAPSSSIIGRRDRHKTFR